MMTYAAAMSRIAVAEQALKEAVEIYEHLPHPDPAEKQMVREAHDLVYDVKFQVVGE